MKSFFPLLLTGLLAANQSPAAEIESGPMVGYSTMREVAVWVQTDSAAEVRLRYWPKDDPSTTHLSQPVTTAYGKAFTAHLIADQVEPGNEYQYEIQIDSVAASRDYPLEFETQRLWQWRGDPDSFSFALGSCAYMNETVYDRPGRPYGGDHHIYQEILKQDPSFMLWMGDNTYLREADWNSRTGIYKRFSHTRAQPELQPLLGAVHHYATWDDHDYGPNDADRSYWNKDITLEAFTDFWANQNYGVNGQGITGTFQWQDVQFFMLDNRWFRSPNDRTTGKRQIFGDEQIEWLIDSLQFSQATFKFVVSAGAFLYNGREAESAINVAPEERELIIRAITQEQIPGVIFLSGDVHHSRLIEFKRDGTYPLYEWAVSSLTAGPYTPRDVDRTNIVPGSVYADRNFGIIEVTGPRRERELSLKIIDDEGNTQWSRKIRAVELCRPVACDLGH